MLRNSLCPPREHGARGKEQGEHASSFLSVRSKEKNNPPL